MSTELQRGQQQEQRSSRSSAPASQLRPRAAPAPSRRCVRLLAIATMQAGRCCGAGPAASAAWVPERRPLVRQRPRLRVAAKAEDAASSSNGKQGCGSGSGGSGACGGGTSAHGSSSGNGTLMAQRPQSVDLAAAKQSVDLADCGAMCATKQRARQRTAVQWPQKSELYLLRSDGHSCTRETVQRECEHTLQSGCVPFCVQAAGTPGLGLLAGRSLHGCCYCLCTDCTAPPALLSRSAASGNLQFECPSSQQQLLVWKTRPRQ